MDLIRLLVAVHPKDWRKRYGEEFAALLEDAGLNPSAVVNVVGHAAGLRMQAHRGGVLLAAVAVISAACETIANLAGLSANILWAPTDPVRALALAGTVGPWIAWIARAGARRRSAQRA